MRYWEPNNCNIGTYFHSTNANENINTKHLEKNESNFDDATRIFPTLFYCLDITSGFIHVKSNKDNFKNGHVTKLQKNDHLRVNNAVLVKVDPIFKEIGILKSKEDIYRKTFYIPFLYCLQDLESKMYKIWKKSLYNTDY